MVRLLCPNMPDREDGTAKGRDPQTGYQERSVGEVLYDCRSVRIEGALLPLTSSSQTADSQEQNPIFRIWHSTDPTELSGPLSVTALQE